MTSKNSSRRKAESDAKAEAAATRIAEGNAGEFVRWMVRFQIDYERRWLASAGLLPARATMTLVVQVTPRAYKAGEHLAIEVQLGAGTCAKCRGKWRVLSSAERDRVGMIRVFQFELEPLDDAARATAALQAP